MPRSESYNKHLLKYLKDPRRAAAYLNAVLEDGDQELFLKALRKVAEARGGMSKLATRTRISRVGLYKVLSERGNPEFRTVATLLSAFHLRMAIQPSNAPLR